VHQSTIDYVFNDFLTGKWCKKIYIKLAATKPFGEELFYEYFELI